MFPLRQASTVTLDKHYVHADVSFPLRNAPSVIVDKDPVLVHSDFILRGAVIPNNGEASMLVIADRGWSGVKGTRARHLLRCVFKW